MYDEYARYEREQEKFKSDELAVRNLIDILNSDHMQHVFSTEEYGKIQQALKKYALITAGLMERKFTTQINNKTAEELIQGPTAKELLDEQSKEQEQEQKNENGNNNGIDNHSTKPWFMFGK